MLLARMVGDQAATRTYPSADHSALRSAHQSAYHCPAHGRAANDFGLRMVPGVMLFLHVLGMVVLALRPHAYRRQKHRCNHYLSRESFHCSLLKRSKSYHPADSFSSRLLCVRPIHAMPPKPASDALKKHFLRATLAFS